MHRALQGFPGFPARHRPAYSPAEANLIRRNRRWFVHVLSLALLFAQLGMLAHASSHLGTDPHAAQAQLCDECVSVASMQNAVGSTHFVLPVTITHDHALDSNAYSSIPNHAFTAFRSRAPPISA